MQRKRRLSHDLKRTGRRIYQCIRNLSIDQIAKYLFMICTALLIWLYGVFAHKYKLFPYPQMHFVLTQSQSALDRLKGEVQPEGTWFFYRRPPGPVPHTKTYLPDAVSGGLVLVYGIGKDRRMMVRIMDNAGNVIHQWDMDIFKLWPDPDHVPEDRRPKSNPGGEIHGLVFLPNGDIVFNFEPVGLMRMNYCGEVIWRLPYFTHHSVHLDDSGIFYVSEQPIPGTWSPEEPDGDTGILNETILEVSSDGKIVNQISIIELLKKNRLEGLLYVSSVAPFGVNVKESDVLHLNDVEPFPVHLEEGVFGRGDILVSLRNLNTILVFNKSTRKIKDLYTGSIILQHDPDFISGNEISIFDNHSLVPSAKLRKRRPDGVSSRIVILDARDNSTRTYFEGSREAPFFTDIMGKHQWLPNGNLLITEPRWGRVFEVTPERKIAWEFNNLLKEGFAEGLLGMIIEGQRLSPEFDRAMFDRLAVSCDAG